MEAKGTPKNPANPQSVASIISLPQSVLYEKFSIPRIRGSNDLSNLQSNLLEKIQQSHNQLFKRIQSHLYQVNIKNTKKKKRSNQSNVRRKQPVKLIKCLNRYN
uniref:Uncharacterized protein n=1 Tax=Cacopsylla melanoneura TaxID=428564 RepID=A0A8D8QFV9_9HEMI